MYFQNRLDAGEKLTQLLEKYQGQEVVVYALPRGGVVVAEPIAKFLKAPLDFVLAHKIGHPRQPEYAIAAISESGHMVGNPSELAALDENWLEIAKQHEMQEIKRKRSFYLQDRAEIPVKGKIAIVVDDGIATGLTMQAGILELKEKKPKKIVVAVPVSPRATADLIAAQVDDFISVIIPEEYAFLGAVGAYYRQFNQVEDDEVIAILSSYSNKD